MRSSFAKIAGVLVLVAATTGAPLGQTSSVTRGVGPTPRYLGPLTFGPDAVLFAADAEDVFIYALDLSQSVEGGVPGTQDVPALDQEIAALLGTAASNLLLTDLAVYPKTGNAFLSVMRGRGDGAMPVLVRVDGAGELDVVELAEVPFSRVRLPNPPEETTTLELQGGQSFPVPNYPSNADPDGPMSVFGV